MNTKDIKPASGKQLKWLKSLLLERSWDNVPAEWQWRLVEILDAFKACDEAGYGPESVNNVLEFSDLKVVTMSGFDKLLERLKNAPLKTVEPQEGLPVIATTDGVFKHGDTFYKLKFAKTGNLWAHRLVMLMTAEEAKTKAAEAKAEAEATGAKPKRIIAAKFMFAGSPKSLGITEDMKLTHEDAKAFGALYSTCCECGRLLTDDLSVYLGIGPVCGGREFGGEFKLMIDEAKLAVKAAKAAEAAKACA